ncbi:MAG: OsmC family protein [Pseudomonadales bacterium]|nr:OsmC family protein [Pseudomonadales bacterium]
MASLSSCHMLWFLALAAKYKYSVACYHDRAVGVMEKNEEGKVAITRVTLSPKIEFDGENIPSVERVDELHHEAHERCFIANSVKTEILIKS